MEIRFSGQVTKKEFQSSFRIMYARVLLPTRVFFGIVLVIITLVLVSVAITANLSIKSYFAPMAFFYVLLTFPWWFPILLSSSYDKNENIYRTPIHGVINENEVVIEGTNQKFSSTWKTFNGYYKSNRLVLIYLGKNGFNILTRDLFASEADWNQLAELLQEKLGEK
jgi:hypothetical protein